jgi:ABC-type multidrug transport system fused ATPase/permease subunit
MYSIVHRVFDVIEASKSDVKTESALKAVSTENIISLVENSSIDIPAIEFINVSFRYKSRSVPIFNGLSLSIKSKMITAIAGRSGSGKI